MNKSRYLRPAPWRVSSLRTLNQESRGWPLTFKKRRSFRFAQCSRRHCLWSAAVAQIAGICLGCDRLILETLQKTRGNHAEAAKLLDLHPGRPWCAQGGNNTQKGRLGTGRRPRQAIWRGRWAPPYRQRITGAPLRAQPREPLLLPPGRRPTPPAPSSSRRRKLLWNDQVWLGLESSQSPPAGWARWQRALRRTRDGSRREPGKHHARHTDTEVPQEDYLSRLEKNWHSALNYLLFSYPQILKVFPMVPGKVRETIDIMIKEARKVNQKNALSKRDRRFALA